MRVWLPVCLIAGLAQTALAAGPRPDRPERPGPGPQNAARPQEAPAPPTEPPLNPPTPLPQCTDCLRLDAASALTSLSPAEARTPLIKDFKVTFTLKSTPKLAAGSVVCGVTAVLNSGSLASQDVAGIASPAVSGTWALNTSYTMTVAPLSMGEYGKTSVWTTANKPAVAARVRFGPPGCNKEMKTSSPLSISNVTVGF